jgi:hypothetical protein
MEEEVRWWMEYVTQFEQAFDIERTYFSKAITLSPRAANSDHE